MLDFLIGAYGHNDSVESQVTQLMRGLRDKCQLENVRVHCVDRAHRPMSSSVRDVADSLGFHVQTCPLPAFNTCREDTSQFADWMVCNVGEAPWVVVSHFDVVLFGDYTGYVKSMMCHADMIGNHHDGMVAVKRESYRRCQVGFCGVDHLVASVAGDDLRILSQNAPIIDGGRRLLSLDVGELLALRIGALGMNHVWLRLDNDVGKSDLFEHRRQGSGHGAKNWTALPEIYGSV